MSSFWKKGLIGLFSIFLVLQPVVPLYPATHEVVAAENQSSAVGTILNEQEITITPGVTQTKVHTSTSRGDQRISMLEVDLSNEFLSIETGIANNSYPGMQPLTKQAQLVSKEGHQVVAGVNGDFFNTSTGDVSGLFIHKGQLLHSSTRPAFGVTADGHPIIGTPDIHHLAKVAEQTFNVTGVNTSRGTNNLIIFTPSHGASTSTNPYGAEVILENVEGDVTKPGTVKATVKELRNGVGNTPLEEGTIVLSGHGTARSFLVDHFSEGAQVEITLGLSEPWNQAVEAIGGSPILVESSKLANLESNAFNNATAPRTAVGIKADGSVFFLVIDGRQPGYSEGVTIHELAQIMLELGAVEAVNLDGGGSSTLGARQPGDSSLSVVNTPSDGSERNIANSIFIVSSAPKGTISSLFVRPTNPLVLANSQLSFEASGLDMSYQPVEVAEPIAWSVEEGLGMISENGVFTAGSEAKSGTVTATAGSVTGNSTIKVVDTIDELQLPQSEVTLDRGGEFDLAAKAIKDGKQVTIDQDQLHWEVENGIGSVDENGYFTATDKSAIGTVTVSYGDVTDTITIEVGKMPIIVEDFENGIDHWTKSGARYNTVNIRQTTYPEPARFGDHALQLDYDFIGTQGTSGAYAYPKTDIELEGYPETIGMWVYGDGKRHWLRAQLKDADGNAFPVDFVNEVDWVGWKYVDAKIPTGKTTPLKLDLAVRYMETSNNKKDAGTIYIDNIRAVYGETNDDLTNPSLSDISPVDGTEVTDNMVQISAIAKDDAEGTGINANRIQMMIDGMAVTPTFNESTGEISYVPEHPFADGIHYVNLVVQDNFGNPIEQTWSFTVNTGSASLYMETPERVYAGNEFEVTISAKELQDMYGAKLAFDYDPSKIEIMDQDENAEGIQIGVSKKVNKATIVTNQVNVEDGKISIEASDLDKIGNVEEDEKLFTIVAKVKSDATEDVSIDWAKGNIRLLANKELSNSINLPDFKREIKYGLNLEVGVMAIGMTTEIKVTNEKGEPVLGAGIFVKSYMDQSALVKSDTAFIYKEKNNQSEIIATAKEYDKFLVVEVDSDWVKVKTRDGGNGWIELKDVTISMWGNPIGITNSKGVLTTNDVTLAEGNYLLQAKKGTDYSVVTSGTVKPLLGKMTPEQIVLTWEQSPKTTQSFTWRTSPEITESVVQLVEQTAFTSFEAENVQEIKGTSFLHETDLGVKQMHEVDAVNLKPNTTYVYRVGDGTEAGWSESGTFTTEPEEDEAFTFLFTSDTQSIANGTNLNGYGIWGEIFGKSLQEYPHAKFMLLSGDIVDYGDQQIHWEYWFDAAKQYLPNINMVPVLGNHDVIGEGTDNFKAQFQLPLNGPEGEIEEAYSFDYGNLHLAVLNTEGDLEKQAQWLIEDMKNSEKDWKIVSFHRSPYHSHETRGSEDIRKAWTGAFDEAEIDLVLSGHDHAYMRSWPLYDGKIVEEGEGTTYIIGGSAGPKFYEMGDQEWIRVAFDENIQIYSGVTIDGNELTFKVTTRNGENVDAFTMVKPETPVENSGDDDDNNQGEDPGTGNDDDDNQGEDPGTGNDDDDNQGEDPGTGNDDDNNQGEDPGTGNDDDDNQGENPGTGIDDDNEGEDPGTGNDDDESDGKRSIVSAYPKMNKGIVTISNGSVEQVATFGTVAIPLKNEENINLSLTEEQVKLLRQKNASIEVTLSGTKVAIPAINFVNQDKAITITFTKLPEVSGAVSAVYDFTIIQGNKEITDFQAPVTLSFSIDKVEDPNTAKIYYYNETKKKWELIGGTYANGYVTATTNHFSVYTVFESDKVNIDGEAPTLEETSDEIGKELPETATNMPTILAIGIVLLIMGGTFIIITRRRKA
nr:phosphodiester glycosidase family protein [Fredinandcohnia onubensis]